MNVPTTRATACFGGTSIPRLGMGCWAIGGPFHADSTDLGYANTNDQESLRAIAAAIDHGIRYFDTAAVYGAGHSERLLGQALRGRDDVFVSTKFGIRFDESTRAVLGDATDPVDVVPAIDDSLRRLQRDRIDLLFLHLNSLDVAHALPLFDAVETAVATGKVVSYGWSTDFTDRATTIASRPNVGAIQHAANVLFSAPAMIPLVERTGLLSINRSPLAMGALTGKYRPGERSIDDTDIRSNNMGWMDWFHDGAIAPTQAARLDAISELLRTGGRTLAQGALCWLWARSPNTLPIPGFRTAAQVAENTAALPHGPLPIDVMDEIETLLDRTSETEQRER